MVSGGSTSERTRVALGDALTLLIDHRGRTPKKLGGDFSASGVPVISAKCIRDGRVTEEDRRFVTYEMFTKWMTEPLAVGDVLVTSEAPLGEVARWTDEGPVCLGQRLFSLRADPDTVDQRFLYYLLRSREVQAQLHGRATGTTAQGIRQSQLVRVILSLPPLDTQRGASNLLGALDDKIEVNRRISETLEEIARALFKSWFVDFDPVRGTATVPEDIRRLFPDRLVDSQIGPVPAGWEVAPLGDIVEVVDCLHSRKPERREEGLSLLQLWNVRDDGLVDLSDPYLIHEDDYKEWTRRMEAIPGDCVVTNVGRSGAVAQVPEGVIAALGRNMTGLRCRESWPHPTYLIELMRSQPMQREIEMNLDYGTVMDSLNVRSIPKLRFVLPLRGLVEAFEERVRPMRAMMEYLLVESRTLAELRDTLLPKLTSGEVRLP